MRGNISRATKRGGPNDWSLFELCILDQVRKHLRQLGADVDAEFGITDEYEPWLIFCDAEGRVIAHFARLGHTYVACVPFEDKSATGEVLSDVAQDFLQRLATLDRDLTSSSNSLRFGNFGIG